MATDLATKVDQLTMRNRMACWLWIQEAGQPIALLSALTGIPRGRLQSLNLNSEDLQTLARHIESLRPLAIDGEVDKRLAEIRARNPIGTLRAQILNEQYRANFPDKWEDAQRRLAVIEEEVENLGFMKQPLDHLWTSLTFVERDRDLRAKECRRCGYEWNSRIPTEPVKCPRCQSPNWNAEAVAGAE